MLRRLWFAPGLLVLGLAACSEGDRPAPTAPGSPNLLIAAGTTLTCDATFRSIKSLAGKEFVTPEQQTAGDIIKRMQAGFAASGKAGATGPGFELLTLLANTVDAGHQAGGTDLGSDLANQTLSCMDVSITQAIDFRTPLDPTKDGAFEVRGATAVPVVTRQGGSAIGIKPGSNSSWSAALGVSQAVIYAQPNSAVVNGIIGSAFDWATAPLVTTLASRTLVLGICQESSKSLLQEDAAIVQFEDAGFLETTPDQNGRKLCGTTLGAADGFSSPLAFLGRMLAPEPAYAAVLNPGGTGGLGKGFSTFEVVDAGNLQLAYTQEPVDGTTSTNFTIKLKATASNTGAPIEGVVVTVSVAGNKGSFTVMPATPSGTTGTDGVASITLQIDKPGGYTLTGTTTGIVNAGSIRNYPPVTATSDLFNLQFP